VHHALLRLFGVMVFLPGFILTCECNCNQLMRFVSVIDALISVMFIVRLNSVER